MAPVNDKRFEQLIGLLLRGGVSIAAAVVLVGGIFYLAGHGHEQRSYRVFQPSNYRNVSDVAQGIHAADWQAVIQLGLLLLIATPVVRVAVSVVAFALEHDRAYVAITCMVLGVLLYSLTR